MKLIISMINARPNSGPFTILRLFCEAASNNPNVETTVLCHSIKDMENINAPRIKYIEFPLSQKSWLLRLFYEYVYFYFFCKKKISP